MEGNWALVGIETTVIGMAVVALILVILMFCVMFLDKAVDKANNKPAGTGKNELPAAAAAPALRAAAPVAASTGLNAKTVAAIMAAVYAASGSSDLKFVAIKRVNSVPGPWAASATSDLINTRQSYL